jgi:molecular chaperone IbpA
MRPFNLAPLYRSTVGFDRVFSLLDQVSGFDGAAPGYPPYNIERTGDNAYRISVAVAGFSEPELSIVTKEGTLTIRGDKQAKTNEKDGEVLYQGIAARQVPEANKPRQIPIGNGKATVVEAAKAA